MSGRTAAVVVHWRALDETLGCLDSLRGAPDVVPIVVDNAGQPPAEPAVRRHTPDAVVVRCEHNQGYAGGANRGIEAARAAGVEAIAILNDDARVAQGAWAAARDRLASDDRIAVVGPRVRLRDDPSHLWLAWGDLTWGQSLVRLHGDRVPDGPEFAEVRDVDWIAGCAMWLRTRALDALGGFDETFFAYHEEVEWCTRARRAGWRVVYDPAVEVAHGGRGTSTSAPSLRIRKYFAARNSVLLARKHGGRIDRTRFALSLLASLPLQWLWHLPRGDADFVLWKLRGVRDGWVGRTPPFEELGLR